VSSHRMLETRIRQHIDAHGGIIGFDDFMRMALYEPGLGYYETAPVFGARGDYITAADMGPWLACGFFDLLHWGWQALGRPPEWTLIEQGGGNGALLCRLLDLLHDADMPAPTRVIEIEISAHLRHLQTVQFAGKGHDVIHARRLSELEPMENVLFISNELPDAFPVRCFHWRNGRSYERAVSHDKTHFFWLDTDVPSDISLPESITAQWPDGYCSEWCPELLLWQQQLARLVTRGLIFTVDYGYAAREYYRPGRTQGTLLAHHQHHVSEDILTHIGQQDITAHVDFSALAEAGRKHQLHPLLWMSQGGWLAQSPAVQSLVQQLSMSRSTASMAMLAHAKRLMLPFGMGETFKLLIQGNLPEQQAPEFLKAFRHTSELLP